jgi:16S rRNA (uracil1498-N3)-methyltransferase
MLTQHTVVDKINYERFKANVKEACEQCERNDFPEILEVKKLDKILDYERVFILCDESQVGLKAVEVFKKIPKNKEIVLLIGPEGGFSKEEFVRMHAMGNVYSLSLGERILRADTAVIAALALVGEFVG